ncbi:MAG: CYTH domain-containing protein [Treponema sp.]|jgi:adenylate cyclase class 2|nr:CYTH domain-containing protein [Treponema sp.]
MYELEIKYKVETFPLEKIEGLGFKKKKESHQIDIYYIVNKVIDGKRTYLRTRKDIIKKEYSFDLHQIKSEFATDEKEIPLMDEKYYIYINDILSIMKQPVICEIDKQRAIFEKNNISIVLDKVENLGNFVEIEIIGEDIQENQDLLFDIAKKLSLDDKNRVSKKGYPDLFIEKNK